MQHLALKTMRRWAAEESGVAAAEFGLVFPILFVMMLGVWDLGNGIVASQKTLAASQVVADLVGRETSVSDDELEQAFDAAEVAMWPYPVDGKLTVQVVSVAFDDEGDPETRWVETSGEGGGGADGLAALAEGLGNEGEGAIVVMVTYAYHPYFGGTVIDDVDMTEIAFARGRKTAVVNRD